MRRTMSVLVAAGALVVAACGQKAGVAGSGTETVTPPPATEQPAPTTAALSTTTSATGPTTSETGGAATTAPVSTAASTSAPGPAGGPYEPGPNDAAGVTDTEIVIGIHAPVTGASPIPQESFDVGKDVYWRFLADSAPDRLFGRKVRVVFRDDQFNPQRAVQVCREMVEQDGAFLLVGGGGADQITACAQYANDNGIPYLSAGVNEDGLQGLATYFATSLTYAEQAPLIMNELKQQGITEAALVVSDTPSFADAFTALQTAAQQAGIDVVYTNRINKDASPAEAQTVAQELKNSGAPAVVLLASPVVYVLGLAPAAANQSYSPVWIGPGITSGLNTVAAIGCPNVATGEFFSPTPALASAAEVDPDFGAAYAQYAAGKTADDVGFQLWSLNKAIAQMLEATGQTLGRAAFMNALVTTPEFDNGIYTPVRFTTDDHFGGTGAFLLKTDCDAKQYVTAGEVAGS